MTSTGLRRIGRLVCNAVLATLLTMSLAASAQAAISIEFATAGIGGPYSPVVSDPTVLTLVGGPITVSAPQPWVVPTTTVSIDKLQSTYQYTGSGRSLLSTTTVELFNSGASAATFYLKISSDFDNTGFVNVPAPSGIVEFMYSVSSSLFDAGGGSISSTSSYGPVAGFGTYTTPVMLLDAVEGSSTAKVLLGTSQIYAMSQLATVTVEAGKSVQFILSSQLTPRPNDIPDLNVPEPASLAIWGLGALGAAVVGMRRKKVLA